MSISPSKEGETVDKISGRQFNDWVTKDSPTFKRSGGYFLVFGGILPVHPMQGICFIFFGFFQIILLFKTSMIYSDEANVALESCNAAIIFTVFAVIQALNLKNAQIIRKVYWEMDEGLHKYGDTLDVLTLKKISDLKTETARKQKRIIEPLKIFILSSLFTSTTLKPLYRLFTGFEDTKNSSKYINNKIPYVSWYPFDVTTWPGFIVSTLLMYYITLYAALIIIGIGMYTFWFFEELTCELKIINLTIKNIMTRVEYCNKTEPGKHTTKSLIENCIKTTVIHQQKTFECFKMVNKITSFFVWEVMFVGTFILCMTAFIFASNDLGFATKFLAGLMCLLMTFILYFMCSYGEAFKTLSSGFGYKIYKNEWYENSSEFKYYLSVIQANTFRPLNLTGGGLVEANMNTFTNVLNSAYSYFSLLKVLMK